MADQIKFSLERLAYLAGRAVTVEERRELDLLLKETETMVDSEQPQVVGVA